MDSATFAALTARVQARFLENEVEPPAATVAEMLRGAYDRVSMRLAPYKMPEAALTIVVEVAVRALRQRGVEGSKSEAMGDGASLSVSVVDDVMAAFDSDIKALRRSLSASNGGIKFI